MTPPITWSLCVDRTRKPGMGLDWRSSCGRFTILHMPNGTEWAVEINGYHHRASHPVDLMVKVRKHLNERGERPKLD
jgi:hypothetical protein